MSIQKMNGKDLKIYVDNGCVNLANNYRRVDDLNVFPVPDGDTGTNMKMTIENGISELKGFDSENISEVAKKLSRGSLMGARGNSGVILSQLFRGIYNGCIGKESVSSLELLNMFKEGYQQAYKAVMTPVEGTLLTVSRVAYERSVAEVDYHTSISKCLEIYLKHAMEALEETPEQLDKLKEANVVDSGGAGYVLIIEGMYKASIGEFIKPAESSDTINFEAQKKIKSDEFGYCTEFIIKLNNPEDKVENYMKSKLAKLGNSIVVVQDEDLLKVHVHTLIPGNALNIGQKLGEFIKLKIENMQLQHEHILVNEEEKPKKKYGVIAVAQGSGLERIFYDFGCDRVITGGQTMNPSTQDFIDAIDAINAENIIIFPNNKNIMLAAEQTVNIVKDKNIIVINSKTIPEGYTALSLLELDSDPKDIKSQIEESIEEVKTGELTFAIRDTSVNGVSIKKGDYMAIIDGKIVYSVSDRKKALNKLCDKILKDAEICTVIYGKDVTTEEINAIEHHVNKKFPEVEIDFIEGKQDIYPFLLSVE